MEGTVSGHCGQNVVVGVVRGHGRDSAHVLIHLPLMVAETAVDWGQGWKPNPARPSAWGLRMVSLLKCLPCVSRK